MFILFHLVAAEEEDQYGSHDETAWYEKEQVSVSGHGWATGSSP